MSNLQNSCAAIAALGFSAVSAVALAQTAPRPLWGKLEPGPWNVGFRIDTVTANVNPSFPIAMWYPAAPRTHATPPMPYRGYVDSEFFGGQTAERVARFGARLASWHGWTPNGVARLFPDGVDPQRLDGILSIPTAATKDATAAGGTFPVLIVATGGLVSNPVLAEFLASHGVIVATFADYRDRVSAAVPDILVQRRNDLAGMLEFARGIPESNSRISVLAEGSGTVVSLDSLARGLVFDSLILQGGPVAVLDARSAASIRVPILNMMLADTSQERRAQWTALWPQLSSAPRLVLTLGATHPELLAASRLAYPEHAADHKVFDAAAAAVLAFLRSPTAASVRDAIGRVGLPSSAVAASIR